MQGFPDESNFFSSLKTGLSRCQVADLYAPLGWRIRKCSWTDYEIEIAWADLVIEAESPILMHGPVADVLVNADRILAPLRAAGVAYSAECYDEARNLLREIKWSPKDDMHLVS
jgi:hypothetical protein